MFWANDLATGEPLAAAPRLVAKCPGCGRIVKPKCGDIYSWHWAHNRDDKFQKDCDTWHEPEGEWHLKWKERVPQHMREYVIKRPLADPPEDGPDYVLHRADILNSRGTVIELQHSTLTPDDVRERESFYVNMIWIFDAQTFRFTKHYKRYDHHICRWARPRRYILQCDSPVFFHFGGKNIWQVLEMNREPPHWIRYKRLVFQTFLDTFFV